jgi:hypothetical protein
MDDLDTYLDLVMIDETMSIAKAKKAGDVVALVVCPHEDHKVCLTEGSGSFMIDLAYIARKTRDCQLEFADNSKDMGGCIGYDDCTNSLADAIENADVPDSVLCMEGNPRLWPGLIVPVRSTQDQPMDSGK